MKRKFLFMAAVAAMLMTACGGNKTAESESQNAEEFAASQPLPSGEYRAVSFQDTATNAVRERFDGRVLLALDPDNSGIYIYENGNRTHFKASVSLAEAFTASDTIFVAKDKDQRDIMYWKGQEDVDTLLIYRGGAPVKVSIERKAITEMPAADVWTRISAQISK